MPFLLCGIINTHNRQLLFIASLIAIMFTTALFIEDYYFLMPCPLCNLQRILLIATGICILFTVITTKIKLFTYIFKIFGLLFSALGLCVALRQIYLQYSPPQILKSCNADLTQIMHKYPLLDGLKIILKGTGDCAKIDFTLFGLSLAVWSALCFLFLSVMLIRSLFISFKNNNGEH